jgi:hypothetical protein
MKAKRIEFPFRHTYEAQPVKIVNDAAISTRGLHGGRMLPLLLLDISLRPDIVEFVRIHRSMGPGDVSTQWGKLEGKEHKGTTALFLKFIRPIEAGMVVEFNIAKQGFLVEQTLTGQGLYLAPAEGDDDRYVKNLDRPKVLVEVPDTGYRETWDKLFQKHLAQRFRSNGLSRSESRQAACSAIKQWQKFGNIKMRDIHE